MCRRSGECKQQGVPFSKGMASYELKEIFIEAKTPTRHQYDSAGICRLSNRIFKSAKPGHILALETANSEIDIFFLVRVVKKEESLRKQEVFDDWGVTFKCPRHSQALKVVRLFPSSRESMWTFCDDVCAGTRVLRPCWLAPCRRPEQQHEDNPYGAQHWCSNSQSLRS